MHGAALSRWLQDEKNREAFVRAEIDRLERMEQLVKRFSAKADFHEAWSNGKLAKAQSTDYGNNLPTVQVCACVGDVLFFLSCSLCFRVWHDRF